MATSKQGTLDDDKQTNRTYPHSLQGMLQYCAEHTEPESTSTTQTDAQTDVQTKSDTVLSNIDDERRGFMESVIQGIQAHDPVKKLIDMLQILQSHDVSVDPKDVAEFADRADEVKENLQLTLEEVTDLCDDIDLAINFEKIGGYELFPRYIHCTWCSGLRWRAAELIAVIVQNNEYCQQSALDAGLLQLLLNVIDTDACTTVRTKALYAVSCLSRDYAAGQEMFMKYDGLSVLLRAMQCQNTKLQTKAAFMLKTMVQTQPKCKDNLLELGIVKQLIRLLREPHDGSHEHMVNVLLSMVQGHRGLTMECKHEKYGLIELLKGRLGMLHGKEQYKEEMEYCTELLKILDVGSTSTHS